MTQPQSAETQSDHYIWRGDECLKLQQDFIRHQNHGWAAHLEGCVLKYLYRYPRKTIGAPEGDLLKLIEYAVLLALEFMPASRVKAFLISVQERCGDD